MHCHLQTKLFQTICNRHVYIAVRFYYKTLKRIYRTWRTIPFGEASEEFLMRNLVSVARIFKKLDLILKSAGPVSFYFVYKYAR